LPHTVFGSPVNTEGRNSDGTIKGISQAIERRKLNKKVIPPELTLNDTAHKLFKIDLGAKVDDAIRKLLKVDELKVALLKSISGNTGIFANQEFNQEVNQYLVDNELDTWGDSIQNIIDDKLNVLNADVEAGIKNLIEAAIKAA
jgi:hypothetical protein